MAEVARRFRVSNKTIARWAAHGRLPHRVEGGQLRFPRASIEELVRRISRGGHADDGGSA